MRRAVSLDLPALPPPPGDVVTELAAAQQAVLDAQPTVRVDTNLDLAQQALDDVRSVCANLPTASTRRPPRRRCRATTRWRRARTFWWRMLDGMATIARLGPAGSRSDDANEDTLRFVRRG
jgi:hypothetical protein